MKKTLSVTAQGDREILVTRAFDAPRELLYEAYTRPELVVRWLGVFGGWSLDVCDMDLVVGGAYRWVWRKEKSEMGVSGVYREITPPSRIVCTEKFDESWYPGEGLVTAEFLEREPGKTSTLQLTLRYESEAARDGVVKSPMEIGLAASYDALERLVTS